MRNTPKQSKRLNVFGLISLSGHLTVYPTENSIAGELIKNSLEDFVLKMGKSFVIILDNGSIHHAKIVNECFQRWEEKSMM